ncbi:hypothetical protein O0L34_g14688 [Tuta absoluta]|nr:hypothetical protein O0L34_g14688 [Tuta absoluta]
MKTLTSSRFKDIPALGRVQLLSDAFALAWSEQMEYSTTLELANYLQRETELSPLQTGLSALGKLSNVLKRTAEYGAFQKFVRQLIGEQYLKTGGLSKKDIINGDDMKSVKMQTLLSSWACKVKMPGCEQNAIELFNDWMNEADPDTNNPIPLDLRRTVYCVAIRRGSVKEWRFMLERKRKANVAAAKEAALTSLTCTNEVWILSQYLEWAITDNSEVRRQDAARVIAGITNSPVGYYIAKDFIYTRIKDIHNAFRGQARRIGGIVKTMLSQFTTQRELDEFLAWRELNAKYLEDSLLAVSQGIEAAKVNIAWLHRNKKTVAEKFREFSSEPDQYKNQTVDFVPVRLCNLGAEFQSSNFILFILVNTFFALLLI